MGEHDRERRLDEELAAMTDIYLNNRTMPPVSDDMQDERVADVVRGLHALLNEDPPTIFQQRLAQRLDQEWERRQLRQPARAVRFTPALRVAAAAAAALIIVGGIALFTPSTDSLQGSVVGEFSAGILIGLGAIVAFAIVGVILHQRGR